MSIAQTLLNRIQSKRFSMVHNRRPYYIYINEIKDEKKRRKGDRKKKKNFISSIFTFIYFVMIYLFKPCILCMSESKAFTWNKIIVKRYIYIIPLRWFQSQSVHT